MLGDRCSATRYGPISLVSLTGLTATSQPSRRLTNVTAVGTGVYDEPDRSSATIGPEWYSSNGQFATSPATPRETRKASGRVPFCQVCLLLVTAEVTTILRSSLSVWVSGSNSAGAGDTLTLMTSTLLSDFMLSASMITRVASSIDGPWTTTWGWPEPLLIYNTIETT
ncbi:Uncharacterised protein [Mycobacterium tuberculosis]|nr:Uncharacterised protein [Mycobacterium tuberculosis]